MIFRPTSKNNHSVSDVVLKRSARPNKGSGGSVSAGSNAGVTIATNKKPVAVTKLAESNCGSPASATIATSNQTDSVTDGGASDMTASKRKRGRSSGKQLHN
jgi:hypothetical protein